MQDGRVGHTAGYQGKWTDEELEDPRGLASETLLHYQAVSITHSPDLEKTHFHDDS